MSDTTNTAIDQVHIQQGSALPGIALGMTASGLGIALLLMLFILTGFMLVPWNAVFLPWAAFAGLLPFSCLGLAVACVSRSRHRDRRSTVAVVLGVLAVISALAASGLVLITALGNHPV